MIFRFLYYCCCCFCSCAYIDLENNNKKFLNLTFAFINHCKLQKLREFLIFKKIIFLIIIDRKRRLQKKIASEIYHII